MKTKVIAHALLLSAALALPPPAASQTADCAGLTVPADIVDCVDRIMRGESSQGISTMEVVTENWNRAMEMQMWSLGTDHALVRILAPRKDAGTATLKAGTEIWNYLPRVDRTIKIPASLMSASWMGSHFTNDDLVKESRLIEVLTKKPVRPTSEEVAANPRARSARLRAARRL